MARKEITYNLPQALVKVAPQKHKRLEWGRGTGKSTVLADIIKEVVHEMPRGKGVIVGETYKQILTRTLPETKAGLEMLGYHQNVHYWLGKRPPKQYNIPTPIGAPDEYTHFMQWYTGFGFYLVSQDRDGTGRGLNTCFVLGDEAALLDKQRLDTDVLLTNRAFKNQFSHKQNYCGTVLASSTPLTAKGRWFIDQEELALKEPEKYLFLRASAYENIENLPADYFDLAKATLDDLIYTAEVENVRILGSVENCFFPTLNTERHTYVNFDYDYYDSLQYQVTKESITSAGDADVNKGDPLVIGMDFGSNINTLIAGQKKSNGFRFLKNFYAKFPKNQDHVVKDFLRYYGPHHKKEIFFYYDRSGNNTQGNTGTTLAEQAADLMRKAGWTVHMMTKGGYPFHEDIFLMCYIIFKGGGNIPVVEFNRDGCKETLVSMTNTPVKESYDSKGRKVIKKDKDSERDKKLPQEHATHLGDVVGYMLWGMFKHRYKSWTQRSSGLFIPNSII